SLLIEPDRAREGRGIGGFLLGALGRVELACVDRESDGEEQGQHQDREEHDGLAFLAFVVTEESAVGVVHRWITNCEPPLRVIWNAPFSRYCEGSGTNGAEASTITRQFRSAQWTAGLVPGYVSGYVTVTVMFGTPIAAVRTTAGILVQITSSVHGLTAVGFAAGLPYEPCTFAERV